MSHTISERLTQLRTRRAGTLGEPDASKRCTSGSAGRGWCSWATKTRPLTRRSPGATSAGLPAASRLRALADADAEVVACRPHGCTYS